MKKLKHIALLAAIACCMGISIMSCKKDKDEPTLTAAVTADNQNANYQQIQYVNHSQNGMSGTIIGLSNNWDGKGDIPSGSTLIMAVNMPSQTIDLSKETGDEMFMLTTTIAGKSYALTRGGSGTTGILYIVDGENQESFEIVSGSLKYTVNGDQIDIQMSCTTEENHSIAVNISGSGTYNENMVNQIKQ